ncbi:hypothetical protein NQT74_12345 [Alteromonas stellipolaris]|uniref:sulfotransferase family protein n=1 Tax=Alteromonas stellipolaris TaxID=233316 RepID=UPI0021188CEC|nr:hypothetical protein [Alteromonas stellipolaris]MCQ8849378.1 hypothetical protein [Alteromonas stellipolaris]
MKPNAIVVIGMHRSGTSAVSGLLSELGVFMGSSLFAPQKGVNEKGFFENSLLVDLNDRLLDEQLLSWDHPLALCINPDVADSLAGYKAQAQHLLDKDYANITLWGMKDPRTTLLLPFWREVLDSKGIKINFVLMLRSPMEVHGSLKKRDGFSINKSMHLWLNYTLSGYIGAKGLNPFILKYQDLLNTPDDSARKIFEHFEISTGQNTPKQSFIDKKLKNQKAVEVPNEPLVNLAMEVFEILSSDVVDEARLAESVNEYKVYLASLSGVLSEHLNAVKTEEVYFKRHFLDAYESIWWKLSWPLKRIESFLRTKY